MDVFLQVMAGVAMGLAVGIFAFLVIVPIHAASGLYVNHPTSAGPSGFHMFTRIAPGVEKNLVRGHSYVRTISGEDPTAGTWRPIRGWAEFVYKKTGLVFTGIYPFQQVREYPLERTKFEQTASNEEKHHPNSNLRLDIINDWSDHHRTQQFLMDVHVAGAEIQNNIPVDILMVVEMKTTDSYKAAFNIDRWDKAMYSLITHTVNGVMGTLTLRQVASEDRQELVEKVAKAVVEIQVDTEMFGINITGCRVQEINIMVDPEQMKALQAVAVAREKAEATRIDGDARADALKKLNEANKAGGDHAVETMHAEAFVNAATAVGKGGGTVILSSPQGRVAGSDPVQTAILTELQKLNKTRSL